MTWRARRQKFRTLLSGADCIHPGSVWDPLSARIAHDLGFEAGMFAGSIASLAVLGAPDLIVLSLAELAEQCKRICRAADFPLLVDADHGYGNALSVRRTVEELEIAGVAALTIEDTLLPRAYGAGEKASLVSLDEGVGKMRAALDARRDPALVILGRTSAAQLTSVDDAIARTQAYEAAGVDGVFLVGLKSRDDLDRVAAATKGPLLLGGASAALMDRDYLASRRVRVALQGHAPFMAAVQAAHATLKSLRDGVAPADIKGAAPAPLMNRLTREDDYAAWTLDYLGGK